MKTCILSYHWKLDIYIYEAFIKHRLVSIVKVLPTKMLSSFWGGAIAPAVPIAFPLLHTVYAMLKWIFNSVEEKSIVQKEIFNSG